MKRSLFFVLLLVLAIVLPPTFAAPHAAIAESGDRIKIDDTYIERAVVSERPVVLTADVRNSKNQIVFDSQLIWSIESGSASVEIRDGNLLFVKTPGPFTVRAVLRDDASVSAQVECMAYAVAFSNLRILTSFENVSVYSQPFFLVASVEIAGLVAPDDAHYEVYFEVLSGPASIYTGNYLKVEGTGRVKLACYSRYDSSVKEIVEFDVVDPDAGKDVPADFELTQNTGIKGKDSGGCGGIVGRDSIVFAGIFLLAATVLFAVKGNVKRI